MKDLSNHPKTLSFYNNNVATKLDEDIWVSEDYRFWLGEYVYIPVDRARTCAGVGSCWPGVLKKVESRKSISSFVPSGGCGARTKRVSAMLTDEGASVGTQGDRGRGSTINACNPLAGFVDVTEVQSTGGPAIALELHLVKFSLAKYW